MATSRDSPAHAHGNSQAQVWGIARLEPISMSLEGKVALVTGASSGIGRVFATYLVQQGCHVAAAARRTAQLATLAAEVEVLRGTLAQGLPCGRCSQPPKHAEPGAGQTASLTLHEQGPAAEAETSRSNDSKSSNCCRSTCGLNGSPCQGHSRGALPPLGQLLPVALDVTAPEGQVDAVVGRVWDHFGGINILVNNAGYRGSKAPVLEIEDGDFMHTLSTNVRGPWVVTKALVRRIVAAQAQDTREPGSDAPGRTTPSRGMSAGCTELQGEAARTPSSSHSSSNTAGCTCARNGTDARSSSSTPGEGMDSPARLPSVAEAMAAPGPVAVSLPTPVRVPDLRFPVVVNIASTAGLEGALLPNGAAYSASKAGVIRLTKALAIELGQYGVRCNAIAPGIFESDITQRLLQKEWMQRNAKVVVPLQRWGSTHPDLTAALHYLVADCSRHVTGACLVVDGGHSLMRMRLDPKL